MAERQWTDQQIQAALDRVDAVRATTGDRTGFKDLAEFGFNPAEMIVYAAEHAANNLARWEAKGVKPDVRDALSVGWLDGIMVGLALAGGE
jgi:hypothetical protein